MARSIPGIFCVEGAWSSRLDDKASVRELLEILEDVDGVDYIHHRVNTPDGLIQVLRQWRQKQYSHYALGYFAFHGKPGRILIGRKSFSLKELGVVLQGTCEGRTLYFGSCSVVQVAEEEISRFREVTKAECVVGFAREIDWLASAALDLILLQALALRASPMEAEEALRREYGQLAEHLGLRMYYDRAADPHWHGMHGSAPRPRPEHETGRPIAGDQTQLPLPEQAAIRGPRSRSDDD